MEYKGDLVSLDSYMNLQVNFLKKIKLKLANTEEYIDGVSTGLLGEVMVRCNNVLYVRKGDE